MLKRITMFLGMLALTGTLPLGAVDESGKAPAAVEKTGAASAATPASEPSRLYVLKPNDVVEIRVYQEEDLAAKVRISRDGSITLPLLGMVVVGSNTVEQAINLIREKYGKDYLVNPQVSLSIFEYAKRRFTVLGQVNRPGTYEMPSDDQLNLLQAVAMGGGYTRIGNARKITVQRVVNGETKIFKLDADSMAKDKDAKPFEVLPDDTITVGEKWL